MRIEKTHPVEDSLLLVTSGCDRCGVIIAHLALFFNDGAKNNITGERVREARIKAGLSQKQLSAKLETEAVYVCRGSISRIEKGERTVTDIEINAIANVLHVSLNFLFGQEAHPVQ